MKKLSKDELIKSLIQENNQLKSQTIKNTSDVDYLSMMAGVSLETEGENE